MEDSPHFSCFTSYPLSRKRKTWSKLYSPLDLIDNEEEFEIETIVSHRRKGHQWQYLVKWKGYPTSDNSWEYEINLEHSEETLNEYKE